MPVEMVKIGMLKTGVKYPLTIALPLKVVNSMTGVPRQYRITGHDMEVPAPIRDFLISDPRYKQYFSEAALSEYEEKKGIAGDATGVFKNVTGGKLTRKPRKTIQKKK